MSKKIRIVLNIDSQLSEILDIFSEIANEKKVHICTTLLTNSVWQKLVSDETQTNIFDFKFDFPRIQRFNDSYVCRNTIKHGITQFKNSQLNQGGKE
jgi:hypothetical protein